MRRLILVSFVGGVMAAASVTAQGGAPVPSLPPDLAKLMQQGENGDAESEEPSMEFREAPRSFEEMVERWMTPMMLPKDSIVRLSEKYAYPHVAVPLKMEIVREEGDSVWLRGIAPERPDSALHDVWLEHQAQEAALLVKRQFDEEIGSGFFLDFDALLVPPPERSSVRFTRKAPNGLPKSGRWQMGFDVADMNGDGIDDLVFGPPRLSESIHPHIFVGDGKGGFSYWEAAKWNPAVPFDYGDVAVADFDRDGFLDIVIAIHFKAQYVLYGSGDGEFKRFEKLPSPESRVTSRAVVVDDFDRDGRMDAAFQAELDLDLGLGERVQSAVTTWVVLNTEQGWKVNSNRLPKYAIGDRMFSADMDGDDRPDLGISSLSQAWRWLVPLNRLPGPWGFSAEKSILGNAFHFDVQPSGEILENGGRPLYAAFRQRLDTPEGKKTRTGLVKYIPAKNWQAVAPEIITQDDELNSYYFRIAVGDVNADGLEDLVAVRKDVDAVEVWTQVPEGGFFLERDAGISADGRVYDLRILDVNGDGRNDLVLASSKAARGETGGSETGGVSVWLSHPVLPAS